MSSAVQDDLRRFASELLEGHGGLVEWSSAERGTAVVPPGLARLLMLAVDEFPLTTDPAENGLCVNLANDFLDVAGAVLEAATPRVGAFHVPDRYLKGGDLHAAIERCYTWLNARVRLRGAHAAQVEYHTWWFFASLKSDDRWESTFRVTLNAASLSEVDLPNPIELPELARGATSDVLPATTYEQAVARARAWLKHAAGDFVGRMDARLARDRKRLDDYYGALLRESAKHRKRSAPPPDPKQVAEKKRAVKLELARKLSELEERYMIHASVEPIVLIRTTIPALAVDLSVLRKRAERPHTLYWNALLKQFEPIACSRCGQSTFSAAFTNDEVAPLCAPCSAR